MSQVLADAHRTQQIRTGAQVEALVADVFRRTVDPRRPLETYPVFLRAAELVIGRGRIESRKIARSYYLAEAARRGLDPVAAELLVSRLSSEQAETALRASGATALLAASEKGLPPREVLEAGQLAVMGSAKRLVLNAGREYLLNASADDPAVKGFARVSDGAPCHFCAMLISRGPVYSRRGARFKAHDRCGCNIRLVYPGDADRGWSKQAHAQEALWKATGDVSTFRSATRALRLGREKAFFARLEADGLTPEQIEPLKLAMLRVKRSDSPVDLDP